MTYGKARIHVKTTVPPGVSLVGIAPHGMMRLERAKLHENQYLRLHTCEGQSVPFDGGKHDLRGSCGTTLTVGNILALSIMNVSTEPQPLELQLAGTVVDADALEPAAPGSPAPELGHSLHLGLYAQEATIERFPTALIPTKELLQNAKAHYDDACRAVSIAFEQACLVGTSEAYDALRAAEDAADRQWRLVKRCEVTLAQEPDTLPPEDGLSVTPEAYERMLATVAAHRGTTVTEVRAELVRLAVDPSARAALREQHTRGSATFSDE